VDTEIRVFDPNLHMKAVAKRTSMPPGKSGKWHTASADNPEKEKWRPPQTSAWVN